MKNFGDPVIYVRNGEAIHALVLWPNENDALTLVFADPNKNHGRGSQPIMSVSSAFHVPPLAEGAITGWKEVPVIAIAEKPGLHGTQLTEADDEVYLKVKSQIEATGKAEQWDGSNLGQFIAALNRYIGEQDKLASAQMSEAVKEVGNLRATVDELRAKLTISAENAAQLHAQLGNGSADTLAGTDSVNNDAGSADAATKEEPKAEAVTAE